MGWCSSPLAMGAGSGMLWWRWFCACAVPGSPVRRSARRVKRGRCRAIGVAILIGRNEDPRPHQKNRSLAACGGFVPKLLFTGGYGDGQIRSESGMGRSIAMRHGIPATDILIEEASRTTQQNLSEARSLMRQHGMRSAIVVSDPLQMKRAMLMADGLGMNAASSPTPTSRYRSIRTKLGFLLREIYFIHHYLATGD